MPFPPTKKKLRSSSFRLIKRTWLCLDQVMGVSTAEIVSLSRSESDDNRNTHTSLGNVEGNQLYLFQTMLDIPVIGSIWCDHVSDNVAPTGKKPSSGQIHCAEYFRVSHAIS